jgi:hypothetical protein
MTETSRDKSLQALPNLLAQLRLNRDFIAQVVAWERFPARPAQFQTVSAPVDGRILSALQLRHIGQFFTHQAAATIPPKICQMLAGGLFLMIKTSFRNHR